MVKYILTDKTGTLTVNEMKFYACSIFCKLFDNEDEVGKENSMDEHDEEKEINKEGCENFKDSEDIEEINRRQENNLATRNKEIRMLSIQENFYENYPNDQINSKATEYKPEITIHNTNNGNRTIPNLITNITKNQTNDTTIKSSIAQSLDKNKIIESFHKYSQLKKTFTNPPFDSFSEAILEFFLNISLNHNVLTETDTNTGERLFQGVNPDEVTLVKTAAELGIEFLDRQNNIITLKIFGICKSFEVIQKFDFTSARMRSSIIVRDPGGQMKLYMKGADTKILEKLNEFSINNLKEKSKTHLDLFAKRGLRTLCYSFKNLDQDYFRKWESTYKQIKYKAINNKNLLNEVEEIISQLEDNMTLLGVSALEDKLQDCVKEDLKTFINAGISVWMLTGDKMDTAESIGYSCRLFNQDTEVFKIKRGTKEETSKRLFETLEKMALSEKELENYKHKHEVDRDIKNNNEIDIVDIGKNYIKSNPVMIKNYSTIAPIFLNEQVPTVPSNTVQVEFIENLDSKSKLNSKSVSNFDSDSESKSDSDSEIPSNNKNFNIELSKYNFQSDIYNNNQEGINELNRKSDFPVINSNSKKFMRSTYTIPLDTKNKIIDANSSRTQSVKNNQIDENEIFNFMKDKSYYDISSQQQIENYSDINKIIIDKCDKDKSVSIKLNSDVINNDNLKAQNQISFYKSHFDKAKNPLSKSVFNPLLRKSTLDNKLDIPEILNFYEQQLDQLDQKQKNIISNLSFKKSKNDSFEKKKVLINFGIVIEGESISHCLNADNLDLFWQLIKKSRSVIACRCSPLQKSQIVSFLKNQSKDITLAIGDGGNDVNMIKTANIGIGIFGKEGYQAAYNSDFAISQFKYLKRLLFFHGRYSLERNSYYSYFFFFKNVIYTLPQFWLVFFSGFSGLNFYDDWYYLGFNSFLTALPIVARTLLNEDIDMDVEENPQKQIVKIFTSDIYKEYRDSIPFSIIKFFFVFLSSLIFSLAIFFAPLVAFKYGISEDEGRSFSFWDHSLCSFLSILIIHFIIIIEDSHIYTWFNTLGYSLQIVVIIIFISAHNVRNAGQISGITLDIFSNLIFWITLLLICSICIIPFLILRRIDLHFSENILNNIRQKKYKYNFVKKSLVNNLEEITKSIRHIVKFKKILKGENMEFDNYADKKVKELVDLYQEMKCHRKRIPISQKRNLSDSNLKKQKPYNNNNESTDKVLRNENL